MDKKFNLVEGGVHEPSKELKVFIDKYLHDIKTSEIFVSLFTSSYQESPLCQLQFAMALALDKRIYLLIELGVMPSPKILKVCDAWEFFDKEDKSGDSLRSAMDRLMDKATNTERGKL